MHWPAGGLRARCDRRRGQPARSGRGTPQPGTKTCVPRGAVSSLAGRSAAEPRLPCRHGGARGCADREARPAPRTATVFCAFFLPWSRVRSKQRPVRERCHARAGGRRRRRRDCSFPFRGSTFAPRPSRSHATHDAPRGVVISGAVGGPGSVTFCLSTGPTRGVWGRTSLHAARFSACAVVRRLCCGLRHVLPGTRLRAARWASFVRRFGRGRGSRPRWHRYSTPGGGAPSRAWD